MNLEIDKELMQSVVSSAILQSLDQQKRDTLIQAALAHLLAPNTGTYGRNTNPLQDAFNQAASNVAMRVAMEMFDKDDTLKDKFRALLNDALVLVMETNRERTVQRIADAITEGMAYRER